MSLRCALIVSLLVLLPACSSRTNKDYAAMNTIPMHAVCVGRMMLELPKSGSEDWQQQFDYAEIEKLPSSIQTKEQFDALVQKRKHQLQQPTEVHADGSLGVYKKVGNNAVIMQYRDPEVDIKGLYTERYLWLGHWGYKYKTGGLFDKGAADLLPRIETTFSQVSPISNQDPPPNPGFCIDSALVTGKTGPIWTSVTVRNKTWKGVSISAGASEDDGSRKKLPWQQSEHAAPLPTAFEDLDMFEAQAADSKASDADDRWVSFDVLRKRTRELAGLPGQEIAFKIKLANGQEYYEFEWVSIGDNDRAYKSGFNFDLAAGSKNFKPDYTPPPPEKELLAVWDAMLDSLKRRPGAR